MHRRKSDRSKRSGYESFFTVYCVRIGYHVFVNARAGGSLGTLYAAVVGKAKDLAKLKAKQNKK